MTFSSMDILTILSLLVYEDWKDIFLFTCVFFNFFHLCLVAFSIQVLLS